MKVKPIRIIVLLLFLYLNIGITSLCQASEFNFVEQIKSKFSFTEKNKLPKVNKGISDKNKYQFMRLDNGLTVLLISDPSADKSAVSMNIGVGSGKDPQSHLGTAHLLEHMLFLGTKNYPDPESYNSFIAKGNGYRNAFTSSSDTNYFLSINSNFLQEALARFSDFFIDPELNPKYIEKEKNAVNSEYKKNLQNDNFIVYESFNATANPNNPENRFFCGNLQTLDNKDGKLYKALTDFFNKYYVAGNMNLAIYSNEKLSVLKYWVKKYFLAIPAGNKATVTKELYVNKAQQAVMVNVETIKNENNLILEFYFPFDKQHQNSSVFYYIDNFLTYNFFNPLKDQGLLLSGMLDVSKIQNNHIKCTLYADLTKKGSDEIEQIITIFFDTINYIKTSEYKDYIVKQEQLIANQQFNYSEAKKDISSVVDASTNMKYFPLENVLDIPYKLDDLDKNFLAEVLANFTWKNMRVFVTGDNLPVDTKLPYYDTKYKKEVLSKKLINRIEHPQKHAFFKAPPRNTFIANDLSIKAKHRQKWPKVIENKKGIRVWHMPDSKMDVPKGSVRLLISNSRPLETAKDAVLNILYARVIDQSIENARILAANARIDNYVYSESYGLGLVLEGFQDKQPELLKEYLQHIKNPKINNNKFNTAKEDIIETLENSKFDQPYQISNYWFKAIVNPKFFLDEDIIAATKQVQPQDLQNFISNYFAKIHLDVLIYGNYSKKEAKYISQMLEDGLLTASNRGDNLEFVRRSMDGNFIFSKEVQNNNSCCSNYYRIKGAYIDSYATAMLTNNLLKENFFSKLRTKEQLGYIVYSTWASVAMQPWLGFVVQSDVRDPLYVNKRIEEFLKKQRSYLENLSSKEFNSYKWSIVKSIRKEKRTADTVWTAITNYDGNVKTMHYIANKISKLNKKDIINFVGKLDNGLDSISIQLWGANDLPQKLTADKKQKACNDLSCFKNLPLIKYK